MLEKENILVCISRASHAELLLERGRREKSLFQGELLALHVFDPESEGEDVERVEEREKIQEAADRAGAEMIFLPREKGRRNSRMIGLTAKQYDISHIILGQAKKSRWDLLVHGSLINELFQELDEVDITIHKVTRDSAAEESQYDRGTAAYLTPVEGGYELHLSIPEKRMYYPGTFYPHRHTDFLTGLFKAEINENVLVVRVVEGEVIDSHCDRVDHMVD
ncbi:universal stress protein [Alkalicoccus chagannorensis]|uniref:universal stress protein n=1 Tax=Alkalicoccus chagannorensis TaxID=427072 RepID=UPI000422EC57|nr:universal stress protein [Alkalicoccus chagannorensis]